jgi:hypothetical protein
MPAPQRTEISGFDETLNRKPRTERFKVSFKSLWAHASPQGMPAPQRTDISVFDGTF